MGSINKKVPRASLVQRARQSRKKLTDIDKGFHEDLYDVLGEICCISEGFSWDTDAYVEFGQEPFWEKCKQKRPQEDDDHEQIILMVARFVFRAVKTKGPRYNRAYKHTRTLQRYAREKVPAADVPKKLAEEGGSDYAFRLETEEHPRQAKSAVAKGFKAPGKPEKGDTGSPGTKPAPGPTRAQPLRAGQSRSNTKTEPDSEEDSGGPYKRIDLNRHFVLEVDDPEKLDEILEMSRGELRFRQIGTESGWRRFKVVKAEPAKSPKLEFFTVTGPKL